MKFLVLAEDEVEEGEMEGVHQGQIQPVILQRCISKNGKVNYYISTEPEK